VEGRDYFFVTPAAFEDMVKRGEFAEYAEVHGYYYGTARRLIEAAAADGVDILLDIDVQGASQIRSRYADAVSIFVTPPSLAELERRIRQRGQDAPQDIERRLAQATVELAAATTFDYCIVNDDLAEAKAAAEHILYAERLRLRPRD